MQSKKPQTTHQNTTYKVAIEDKCAVLLQHCRTMYSNVEIDSHSLTQRALFSEVEPSLSRWKFSQQMLLLQGAEKWHKTSSYLVQRLARRVAIAAMRCKSVAGQ